jgi:hypothetical protein
METQIVPSAQNQTEDLDPIDSFPPERQSKDVREVVDHGLDCACGVMVSLRI